MCTKCEHKNQMKPTNPNADTYVEEQRQHLFITFSSEPTCGTPRRDTLRNALGNTLAWHSSLTLLLDTSYLTLLQDTLTWLFGPDTLARHSCSTLIHLRRHRSLTLTLPLQTPIELRRHESTWHDFRTCPDALATVESLTAVTQTVANGCEGLRTQTQLSANTASPPHPKLKREPSLRIRGNIQFRNCK